jgi:hypothetical protein
MGKYDQEQVNRNIGQVFEYLNSKSVSEQIAKLFNDEYSLSKIQHLNSNKKTYKFSKKINKAISELIIKLAKQKISKFTTGPQTLMAPHIKFDIPELKIINQPSWQKRPSIRFKSTKK